MLKRKKTENSLNKIQVWIEQVGLFQKNLQENKKNFIIISPFFVK